MKRTAISFLIFVIFFLPSVLAAQSSPEKYGNISEDHLKIDSVPFDSIASAVILFDFGDVWFDSQLNLNFKRHKRIKILNESGFDQANISIGYYSKNRLERIRRIKAQTINATEDGGYEVIEVDKRSFFDEDIDGDHKRLKFSFPAVRPGSIIEYEYEMQSKSPHLMPHWHFQDTEPTLYSEFNFEIPELLRYRILSEGSTQYYKRHTETSVTNFSPNIPGYMAGGSILLNTTANHYSMKNIKALREEPYMRSVTDYLAKIRFQFAEIHYPNGQIEPVISTWEKVADELDDLMLFGKAIQSNRRFRTILEEIPGYPAEDELADLIAIYDHLKNSMNWDGTLRIIASDRLDRIFERKAGSSADINLLLFALLNEAGINVKPVLTSTRSNGSIWKSNPFIDQFNYVMVLAEIDGERYLLDATDPDRPYTVLPGRVLNSEGWIVQKEITEWILINNDTQHVKNVAIKGSLLENGEIMIDFQSNDTGYYDLNYRKELKNYDSKADFLRDVVFKDLSDFVVEDLEITYDDDKARFTKSGKLKIENITENFNDLLFLNPLFLNSLQENPLKNPDRQFPVDFGFENSFTYTLHLQIPDGYLVEDLPANKILRSPDNSLEIRRICQVQESDIQFLFSFKLRKSIFSDVEYDMLREFFNQYYALQQDQIVLKKS
ncbi:MAG: DUF3857 domain-containing protein [Balneolaceae bacterium]